MDELQRIEISFIQGLQETFANQEGAMLTITNFGGPKNAFLVCFPLALSLIGARTGIQVLMAAVASEWLNAVLKWLIMGQRPYWWVQESPVYMGQERPFLKQFKNTCETGPGCPSGHVMVTAAVWFIIVASVNEVITSDIQAKHAHKAQLATKLTWVVYTIVMVMVALSRVYIATHFPHQVLLGLVTGVCLGEAIRHWPVENYGFGRYFLISLFVFTSVFVEYHLLSFAGMDPVWTMKLALRRCVYREWVHLDTTLFYAIARDIGAFVFAGMMCSCLTIDYARAGGRYRAKMAAACLTVAAASVVEGIRVPSHYTALFYVLSTMKYGLVSIVIIGLYQIVINYGRSNSDL